MTTTYYHAKITKRSDHADGYETYYVRLLTASEDGYELVGAVDNLYSLIDAQNFVDSWTKHGATILPFLHGVELADHRYDDYPDPTDVEEMKYA